MKDDYKEYFDSDEANQDSKSDDKVRDPLLESTQFPHRFGQPSEFADLAVHIVENAYLNGETIRLDSGMRMKPR